MITYAFHMIDSELPTCSSIEQPTKKRILIKHVKVADEEDS